MELICKGLTNNEIGDKLFISNRTVDNHRAKLLEKTETRNTAELVTFVITNKLVKISKAEKSLKVYELRVSEGKKKLADHKSQVSDYIKN